MEKRTITQIKVWKLIMNLVTGRAQDSNIVAISDDRQKLINWYKNELSKSTPWRDDRFLKTFNKGSILEWYNPLHNIENEELELFGQGIMWEWVEENIYNNLSIFKI